MRSDSTTQPIEAGQAGHVAYVNRGSVRGEAAPDVGLSISTKLPATGGEEACYKLRIYDNGAYMQVVPEKVRRAADTGTRPPTGGVRQSVSRFTSKSKRGLKDRFHQLNRTLTERALFVTLTYHANMQDAAQAKKHLHTFDKRLQRAYPESALIWKMEPQKRGSIHFHLLVFGPKFIPHEWIAATWGDIVAPGDIEQLQAGTSIEAARSFWEARHYLEKYIGKTFETDLDSPGRFWGTRRLERYESPITEVPLTPQQATVAVRTLDRWHRAQIIQRWQAKVLEAHRGSFGADFWCRRMNDMRRRRKMGHEEGFPFPIPDAWMNRWARRRRKLQCRPAWAYGMPVACSARWYASVPDRTAAQVLSLVLS